MSDPAVLPPDNNRGPEILAICGTAVGVALAVVALRIWVRVKIIGKMGWDDYFMIAAMTTIFVEMMVIIPQVRLGAGRHYQYIDPPSNISKGLHLNFVTQPLCLIALCLTKISVGLFLLRMTPSPRFRYTIWGVMIFTVLSATGNLLTVFFQCRPLAFTWDTSVPGGQCIPASHLKFAAFFNSSVAAVTDFLFALLPIPMLWKVQLNWKVKIAVTAVLSLGLFATAAAIVKITFLSNYGKHGDFLYDSSDLTIWTTIEICTAILAASIPCLKPLFKAILSGSSAERYGSKYNNNGYYRSTGGKKSQHGPENNGNIELYGRSRHTTTAGVGNQSRTGSEESIIYTKGSGGEGITKTTQVIVTMDDYTQETPKSIL